MTGELITFPIRFGLRAARFAVRGGIQASERAISVASFVVKTATSSGSRDDAAAPAAHTASAAPAPPAAPTPAAAHSPAAASPPASERSQAREQSAPTTTPRTQPDRPAQTTQRPSALREPPAPSAPPRPEPAHVSEEPTLVEEFAEPGAEDGAGAQVTIAEPWEGYADMNAKDVIARAADANAVELAAVQLYEAAHRSRETVMTAVERELRAKSGRGAATADQTRKEHTNGG